LLGNDLLRVGQPHRQCVGALLFSLQGGFQGRNGPGRVVVLVVVAGIAIDVDVDAVVDIVAIVSV